MIDRVVGKGGWLLVALCAINETEYIAWRQHGFLGNNQKKSRALMQCNDKAQLTKNILMARKSGFGWPLCPISHFVPPSLSLSLYLSIFAPKARHPKTETHQADPAQYGARSTPSVVQRADCIITDGECGPHWRLFRHSNRPPWGFAHRTVTMASGPHRHGYGALENPSRAQCGRRQDTRLHPNRHHGDWAAPSNHLSLCRKTIMLLLLLLCWYPFPISLSTWDGL